MCMSCRTPVSLGYEVPHDHMLTDKLHAVAQGFIKKIILSYEKRQPWNSDDGFHIFLIFLKKRKRINRLVLVGGFKDYVFPGCTDGL